MSIEKPSQEMTLLHLFNDLPLVLNTSPSKLSIKKRFKDVNIIPF